MEIEEYSGELPRKGPKRDIEVTNAVKAALEQSTNSGRPQIITGLDNAQVHSMAVRVRNIASTMGLKVTIFRRLEDGSVIFSVLNHRVVEPISAPGPEVRPRKAPPVSRRTARKPITSTA